MDYLLEAFNKLGVARDALNSGDLTAKQREGLWELDNARDIIETMLRDREDTEANSK